MRLNPEYALLARAAAGPAPKGPGQDQRPLRWPLVLGLAERHRLLPLLDRYVRAQSLDVPDFVRSRLQEATLSTTAKNLFLRSELHRLAGALTAHGIPAMVLKGAALVELVYIDLGLRPMLDLDLLVPVADAHRAEAAILDLGYRPNPMQTPQLHDWMRREHHSGPALVRYDNMVAVDLHRHLSPNCTHLDTNEMWLSSRPSGDGSYLLPAAEDALLHVALHFCRERERRSDGALGQLADLAWLSATPGMDWDVICSRARRWGVEGRLSFALFCVTDLLGPSAPARVLEEMCPVDFPANLARKALRRRVLDTKPWVQPNYFAAHGDAAYTPTPRPLRRAFPSHAYLIGRTEASSDQGYARLYVRRAASALPNLARPWRLPASMKLGRWLKSLDADEN
jgi:hypothetical protein